MKKFLNSLKIGFQNINLVASEGKAKILLRPFFAGLILCLGLYYYNGGNEEVIARKNAEISSHRTQREKMDTYRQNKGKIEELEKYFPDVAQKNEWLVTEVIETFNDKKAPYTFTGGAVEESGPVFIASTIGVTFNGYYSDFGRLVAALESNAKYFKVYEILITKEGTEVGTNKYVLKVGTVFPKEKLSVKKGGNK